jgi:hypothetical protein
MNNTLDIDWKYKIDNIFKIHEYYDNYNHIRKLFKKLNNKIEYIEYIINNYKNQMQRIIQKNELYNFENKNIIFLLIKTFGQDYIDTIIYECILYYKYSIITKILENYTIDLALQNKYDGNILNLLLGLSCFDNLLKKQIIKTGRNALKASINKIQYCFLDWGYPIFKLLNYTCLNETDYDILKIYIELGLPINLKCNSNNYYFGDWILEGYHNQYYLWTERASACFITNQQFPQKQGNLPEIFYKVNTLLLDNNVHYTSLNHYKKDFVIEVLQPILIKIYNNYVDHHLLKPFHPSRRIILLDAFNKFHLKY